ncbi:hypothetical protein SAMN05192574_103103 [Mucilaginibacter gossypiicola]|uniref:Uncharacterized protein n=1 Tax=Mucilaginibacter gossypiicola TaxID=551995 RepID=A0A1H8GFC7_9SPHI|nr:hypothetical protein SAMN05192574_103103 [Mucilaginibacter gossypiicola]
MLLAFVFQATVIYKNIFKDKVQFCNHSLFLTMTQ